MREFGNRFAFAQKKAALRGMWSLQRSKAAASNQTESFNQSPTFGPNTNECFAPTCVSRLFMSSSECFFGLLHFLSWCAVQSCSNPSQPLCQWWKHQAQVEGLMRHLFILITHKMRLLCWRIKTWYMTSNALTLCSVLLRVCVFLQASTCGSVPRTTPAVLVRWRRRCPCRASEISWELWRRTVSSSWPPSRRDTAGLTVRLCSLRCAVFDFSRTCF